LQMNKAVEAVESNKKYWLFTALDYSDPRRSIFALCKTRAEADMLMCRYLPIDVELKTIQEQHNEDIAFDDQKFEIKSRADIIKRGYFFNPYGDARSLKERYNGYYSIFAVRPLTFGNCTRLSDSDIFDFEEAEDNEEAISGNS